ncbi:PEP-CTERM domain protein [Alteromonas mediterranea]|uniref:PEP-CTERM sorting domain-containing protein n=1 Tax=Alteromonas mediterranea TaxID=314275 RepID=UPI0009035890|nr:PEP-CTERM sorting domain-containing protein [Alteromonas mediterranea]APE02363.1 PEP-CTERM domain protein [Alteromonas mediterranea]QDG38878.1 PEP-CTERM sorting domain-containing protein [Alteromonas mediterranea]
MKKFILMVLAFASFTANAAIIEISTDKTIYQVGETITATVSFSNEDAFLGNVSFPQPFDVYNTTIGFNDSLLSFIGASTLSPFGIVNSLGTPVIEMFLPPFPTGGVLEIGSLAFLEHIDLLYQLQTPVVGLYTVQFLAQSVGDTAITGLSGSYIFQGTRGGLVTPIQVTTSSFTVAQVPAPGTFALSLLALGGMVFARKRAKQ